MIYIAYYYKNNFLHIDNTYMDVYVSERKAWLGGDWVMVTAILKYKVC